MGAGFGAEHRDAGGAPAVDLHGDGDGGAIIPILIGDGKRGAGTAGKEVRGYENFHAILLRVFSVFGVGARD